MSDQETSPIITFSRMTDEPTSNNGVVAPEYIRREVVGDLTLQELATKAALLVVLPEQFEAKEKIGMQNGIADIYNPEMVSWVDLNEAGGGVAVITKNHLVRFMTLLTGPNPSNKTLVEKLDNSLRRRARPNLPYGIVGISSYFHFDLASDTLVLRADKLVDLATRLITGELKIIGVGDFSVDFLSRYADELLAKNDNLDN